MRQVIVAECNSNCSRFSIAKTSFFNHMAQKLLKSQMARLYEQTLIAKKPENLSYALHSGYFWIRRLFSFFLHSFWSWAGPFF